MLFRRTAPQSPPAAEPPPPDYSRRRQGSVEALNLVARSIMDAAQSARDDVEPGTTDNFVAGQMMAFGLVIASIEREREALLQQLVREAGLSEAPEGEGWNAEMALLQQLPLSSDDLFRLAMDFRKVEEPAEVIEFAEVAAAAEAALLEASALATPGTESGLEAAVAEMAGSQSGVSEDSDPLSAAHEAEPD